MNKLFERGCIGGLDLKNRVVMPAMGCSFALADGTAGAQIMTQTTLKEVSDAGILVQDAEGSEKAIPADLVVLAMGVRSDQSLRQELEAEFDRVILVGDAQRPGQIREALHAALDKALVY